MAEVRLTQEARADLETIRTYGVEHFGEAAAERHLRGIRDAFDLLARHPLAGQERPEFQPGIRATSRRPHRILYSVDGGLVLIIRVIHQARDVPAALAGGS